MSYYMAYIGEGNSEDCMGEHYSPTNLYNSISDYLTLFEPGEITISDIRITKDGFPMSFEKLELEVIEEAKIKPSDIASLIFD